MREAAQLSTHLDMHHRIVSINLSSQIQEQQADYQEVSVFDDLVDES